MLDALVLLKLIEFGFWILKEGTEETVNTKQKMYRTKKDQIQLY